MADCSHCWHDTGTAFLCFPPAHSEICCHCGAKRTRYEELPKVPEGHGPHHPNAPHRYTLRNITVPPTGEGGRT